MGGVCGIGSIKGHLSPIGSLQGALSIPVTGAPEYDIYDGEYTITPTDTAQVLVTANKLLEHDIVIEASPGILPEGSEMASEGDVDEVIEDVFGSDNPPSYDEDDIATEEEVDEVITDVFGTDEPTPEPEPDEPTHNTDDIATEDEVDDVISDVFG